MDLKEAAQEEVYEIWKKWRREELISKERAAQIERRCGDGEKHHRAKKHLGGETRKLEPWKLEICYTQ